MNTKSKGLILMLAASLYLTLTTEFWGNNMFPNSLGEFITDATSVILLGIGFYLYKKK